MNVNIKSINRFFERPFFRNPKTLFYLWVVILPLISWLKYILGDKVNNYKIFVNVFWHTFRELPLYAKYATEYFDINHYGVFFSLVIAPFALLPTWLGLLLWLMANAAFIFYAVRELPKAKHTFLYWFCANELLTALFMQQFNIAIAACVILSFVYVEKQKDGWATFFIMLGAFVKIYSLGGLAFFFFSKHKLKYFFSALGWAVLFFLLPMLISSPHYVLSQYIAWVGNLVEKNTENLFSPYTNTSLLGIVRKISQSSTYSDLYLIGGGLVLFLLPYFRFNQYKNLAFRYFFLASALMFIVLFSTGSESSGYITALLGVAIWYTVAPWKRSRFDMILLVFAFILTTLSPTDLIPRYIRAEIIRPYDLKALPSALIWFKLCYELLTKDFASETLEEKISVYES
jgi:hypothetical protein